MAEMVERTKMLNVRVTEDEAAMLKDLAEHQGLNASDVVRQWIRREHAEAFPTKPGAKKR